MRGIANCNAVTRAQRPGPELQLKPASNKLVYVNRGFSPAARMSNAPARRLKITGSSSPIIRFSVRVIRAIFNEPLSAQSVIKLLLNGLYFGLGLKAVGEGLDFFKVR